MPVDRQFVDVDDLSVTPDGVACGVLEGGPQIMADPFGEVYAGALIPRSQWKTAVAEMQQKLRNSVRVLYNQGGNGSCVGQGNTACFNAAAFLQFGEAAWRRMSPMSLYKRIGRSASSGAYISSGVNELHDRGILPVDSAENEADFDHCHPEQNWNARLPSGWETTAAHFRVTRWLKVQTVEEWFTALHMGKPIVYGRSGHCIACIFAEFDRGDLYFGYQNSWGQWGDHLNDIVGRGCGWDSERTIRNCVGWAAESVTIRPEIEIIGPAA